jgi:hypothetical protein
MNWFVEVVLPAVRQTTRKDSFVREVTGFGPDDWALFVAETDFFSPLRPSFEGHPFGMGEF